MPRLSTARTFAPDAFLSFASRARTGTASGNDVFRIATAKYWWLVMSSAGRLSAHCTTTRRIAGPISFDAMASTSPGLVSRCTGWCRCHPICPILADPAVDEKECREFSRLGEPGREHEGNDDKSHGVSCSAELFLSRLVLPHLEPLLAQFFCSEPVELHDNTFGWIVEIQGPVDSAFGQAKLLRILT